MPVYIAFQLFVRKTTSYERNKRTMDSVPTADNYGYFSLDSVHTADNSGYFSLDCVPTADYSG